MKNLTITTEQINEMIENPSPMHSLILASDLATFIAYTHFAINGANFQFQDFHFKVIEKLQAIVEQKNVKRNLAICMPVGAGKTLLIQYFIAWSFARSMNNAYVYASHSATNIVKLSREVKDMFSHKFLQSLFKLKLKPDEGSKTNWSFQGAINKTGLLACAIGSGITGADSGNPNVEGYSGAAVLDDVIDAGKIRRVLALEEVNTNYDEKIATRRRTPWTPTIAVMQRFTEGDFIGWIKKNEPDDWDIVEIKALNDNGTSFWESRYPAAELKKIRNSNPSKFYAQYQQSPIKEDGSATFNKGSLAWYDVLPQMDSITDSWDTAVKVKQVNDYTSCSVWGEKKNNVGVKDFYLIYVWRGKVLYPALKAKFKEINSLYNPNRSLIEDKSGGETLIPDLKNDGYSQVKAVQPGTKDKVQRSGAPSEIINQGRVFIPKDAPWLDDFLDELLTFPNCKHDDQVDTLTQFLNWASKPQPAFRIIPF